MRHITAIVDVNGKAEVATQLIGYSGEHNAVLLEVGFTEEGLSLYSTADYFRIVVDGFYSDKLFLNQNNVIQYNLPQDVMKPPKINCQLLGYKGDESEINLILKSCVFSFQVDCSEVPFQKLDNEPDYFEEALHICTAKAESAKSYSESANDFCQLAQSHANSASNSEYFARTYWNDVNLKANEVAVNANRAERAAESVDSNNIANALKGNKTSVVVSMKDVSPIAHNVNIQLKNEDGSPCITEAQTIIEQLKVGTDESDSYNWADVASDNIFRVSLSKSTDALKVSGIIKSVAVAPIIDGQIELGENAEVYWIDYSSDDSVWYLNAEFSITDGVLNWSFSIDYDSDVENGVWEGGEGSYETAIGENQKITGFAIKCGNPDNSEVSFSVESLVNKDVSVKVCGKNLFDKSKSIIDGLKNETAVAISSTVVMENDALIQNLKPNVKYTLSYEVECLSVPENATCIETAVGLLLRNRGISGNVANPYFRQLKVGDVINHSVSFTLTEERYTNGKFEMLGYCNNYTDKTSGAYVKPSMIIRNIQIEEGARATEYEPYIEPTTYTADENGKLTLPSVYPSMTVYTKNDGIKVNAQYNRDVNKVIKSLVDAVVSLGGKVND